MQEKINKVALKFAKKNSDLYETSNYGSMYLGFINGAKWQSEKMYSKKDLFNILVDYVSFPHDYEEPRCITVKRFLKQLKNK